MALSEQVRQELSDQLLNEATESLTGRPSGDERTVEPVGFDVLSPVEPGRLNDLTLGAWYEQPVQASTLTEDGALQVVDQRRLPSEVIHTRLETASDVADGMRAGVIDGGLATAVTALQAVAMVTARVSTAPETSRSAIVAGAVRAIRGARPDIPLVGEAFSTLVPEANGHELPSAEVLRSAAAAMSATIVAEHRALALAGGAWIRERLGARADVVLVGEFGPAATGSVGTTYAILRAAADFGTRLRVWLPEGHPPGRAAAILSAGGGAESIQVNSFADYRLNQILTDHSAQAVLLGASWASEDGSLASQLGSVAAALTARDRGIAVMGVVSRSMVVRGGLDQLQPARQTATGFVPLERVDARLVDLVLTDAGVMGASGLGKFV